MAIDKAKVAQRFIKAKQSYDEAAVAQQHINQLLIAQLAALSSRKPFKHVLEIGCGTGNLSQQFFAQFHAEKLVLNDLDESYYPVVLQKITPFSPLVSSRFLLGDAERIDWGAAYDLILSGSAVQWFDSPKRFIEKAAQALNTQGTLLFNSFAPTNLTEIRQLTGVGLVYPGTQEWRAWLQADFERISIVEKEIRLVFEHPLAVLKHLRQTGVTALSHQAWSKSALRQFCEDYQRRFAAEEGVYLTYAAILICAVKA